MLVPSPSFEERIRDLCTKLVAVSDDEEWQVLAVELRRTIHEHADWVKTIAEKSAKDLGKPAA